MFILGFWIFNGKSKYFLFSIFNFKYMFLAVFKEEGLVWVSRHSRPNCLLSIPKTCWIQWSLTELDLLFCTGHISSHNSKFHKKEQLTCILFKTQHLWWPHNDYACLFITGWWQHKREAPFLLAGLKSDCKIWLTQRKQQAYITAEGWCSGFSVGRQDH